MKTHPRVPALGMLVTLVTLGLFSGGSAMPAPANEATPPPRVALVLSGGGARGAAHVGVLEVLEEHRIPVDFIVGTSMGAIVGGLYASGLSPEEIRERLARVDWSEVLEDSIPRDDLNVRRKQDDRLPLFDMEFGYGKEGFGTPTGLISDQAFGFLLEAMTLHASAIEDFDDLPIPFRAIAVDLQSGQPVVLGDGDLTTAIRASMSFPGAFSPVELDDMNLVDGGVLLNMPIEVAIDRQADHIVAVEVGTPLGSGFRDKSTLGVLRRTYSVMAKQGVQAQYEMLEPDDVLITPDLEGISTFAGFDRVIDAIDRGSEAARDQLDALLPFAVSEQAYARFLESQRAQVNLDNVRVASIQVEGLDRVSAKQVVQRLQVTSGETIEMETLEEDLNRVYQIGEFEQVGFRVIEEDDENTLVVDAREKGWGPWYFRVGASVEANFSGVGNFAGVLLARRPEINDLGAEWRSVLSIGDRDTLASEFYQPITYSGEWFVAPSISLTRQRIESLVPSAGVVNVDQQIDTGQLDFGYNLGNIAQFRIGAYRGKADLEALVVSPQEVNADLGGAQLRLVADRIDSFDFPRHGDFGSLELRASRDALGATDPYDRLFVRYARPFAFGKQTLMPTAEFGTSLGSDLPFYDNFRLGGFLRLSGFERDVLFGTRMGLARLIYYYEMGKTSGKFTGNLYLGGSLEAGNVWQPSDSPGLSDLLLAGSVFAGVETILGPLYLGYGYAEGGSDSLYLYMGRFF